MKNYTNYYIEDFVLDADFQKWVRYQDETSLNFWNNFRLKYPKQAGDLDAAEILLRGIYRPQFEIASEEEIQKEIAFLISRIQTNRLQPSLVEEEQLVSKPRRIGVKWWFSAACIALMVCFGIWFALRVNKQSTGIASLESKVMVEKSNSGSVNQIVKLEDGSTVELWPGAVVRYAPHFDVNIREVRLSGEALFRVTKDSDRPFLVYANDLVTRVLGTTFLVRCFKGSKESTIEVTEGKVSVYRQADFELVGQGSQNLSKGIILTANQKVVFQKEENLMTKSLIDIPKIVLSMKAQPAFVYRNTPIGEVLTDIERAYQVDIIFDKEQLKDCPITAVLVNQTLMEKIEIICETVEARFEVLDGQIVVYGKKCTE